MSAQAEADHVTDIRQLLGEDVVLLPIKRGEKRPTSAQWKNATVKDVDNPAYVARLKRGNIGVLLGKPSNGLCSIDIDDDAELEKFLDLNAGLRQTLRTRGVRGGNIWVRIIGEYPKLTALAYETEKDDDGKPKKWGEWRATGGQTVISGKHPSGSDYQIVHRAKPVEITFESIVWPDYLSLPWDLGLYDELVQKQGEPFGWKQRVGIVLNQPFFVVKFNEEHVVLHEPDERTFYVYDEPGGLWRKKTPDLVKLQFAEDLKRYADSQGLSDIERMRTNGLLSGLTDMLRGVTQRREAFGREGKVIHLANGMLHLDTSPPELREFSPSYYSRNQCPIPLVEGADCPRFKREFLEPALDPDDIWLLQRIAGATLLGRNIAQRLLLLTGKAGGGKSRWWKS